jgi:hypothetical protein
VIHELRTAELEANPYLAPQVKQQHVHAVVWALHLAPTAATAAGVAEQLIRLPIGGPSELLDAGVRIPYEQVLAAARNMVPNAGVWLYAQHTHNERIDDSDTPAAAVAICCYIWQPELHQLLVRTTNGIAVISLHRKWRCAHSSWLSVVVGCGRYICCWFGAECMPEATITMQQP